MGPKRKENMLPQTQHTITHTTPAHQQQHKKTPLLFFLLKLMRYNVYHTYILTNPSSDFLPLNYNSPLYGMGGKGKGNDFHIDEVQVNVLDPPVTK